MPGLEGDLEEWQTPLTSRVCHSSSSPERPGIICFVIPDSSTFPFHFFQVNFSGEQQK